MHVPAATLSAWTAKGWEVVYRDANGAQLKKRKQWNRWRIGLFVLLPVLLAIYGDTLVGRPLGLSVSTSLFVFAGLSLFIQIVLYLMKRDELRYASNADLMGKPTTARAATAERVGCWSCQHQNAVTAPTCQKCGATDPGR